MFHVAIAGRPNVGKSTLFNRLIGRRRAITERTPGVTRDPVSAPVELDGVTIVFTDTGGYTAGDAAIDRRVSDRALAVVAEADCVLLLLEYQQVTAEDELFLEAIRRYRDKVLLVVNKIDTPEREHGVYEFYRYGFEPVLGVSAEHGRGIDELKTALLDRLLRSRGEQDEQDEQEQEAGPRVGEAGEVPTAAEFPDTAPVDGEAPGSEPGAEHAAEGGEVEIGAEIGAESEPITLAILGQPNTGKSTLANALLGYESSIVDSVPGTTRDVVEGEFGFGARRYRLLDTAGMRRRSRVDEPLEYYSVNRAVATLSESDVVLLVVDAQKGVTEQDKKIAGLVVKRGCGVVLVLNKWDLMSGSPNEFAAVSDRVRFVFPVLQFAPIVAISAQEGRGFKRMLKAVEQVHRELGRRVDTGRLNRSLQSWVAQNPPPMVNGRRPKLLYATQTGTRPLVFVLFAGRKRDVPDSYVTYIKNRIREEYEFRVTPIRVEIRDRGRHAGS